MHEGPYEYSAKRASKTRRGEEQSDTIVLFVSLVPHARIVHHTGKEPAFRNAQEEADSEEPGEVLGDTHESGDNSPDEGESREPEPWSGEFEDDVAWDLEQDVADEVDG